MALTDFYTKSGTRTAIRTSVFSVFILIIGLFVAPSLSFSADPITPEAAEQSIQKLETSLAELEARSENNLFTTDEIKIFRSKIETILNEANAFREGALARVNQYKNLLAAIGPKPEGEEDAQRETPEISQRRKELNTLLVNSEGRVKRADLIRAQAELLLKELTQASRTKLTKQLLQRRVSPITLSPWPKALDEFFTLSVTSFVNAPVKWAIDLSKTIELETFLLPKISITALVAIVSLFVRNWLLRRYGRISVSAPLSYTRRLIAGFVEGFANGLVPVLFVLAVWVLVRNAHPLDIIFETTFNAVCLNLAIFFFAWGFISGVLTPNGGDWRITSLTDRANLLLARRLKIVMVVFISFQTVHQAFEWAPLTQAFQSVFAFVFMLTLYPVSASLMQGRLWETVGGTPEGASEGEGDVKTPTFAEKIRRFIAVALIALPVTAGAGYPDLSLFLARAVVFTGIITGFSGSSAGSKVKPYQTCSTTRVG